MIRIFRDQPRVRWVIGTLFVVFVWIMYLIRVIWGVGPMHDYEHKQAPAEHYLYLALIISGIVAVWLIVRAKMARPEI